MYQNEQNITKEKLKKWLLIEAERAQVQYRLTVQWAVNVTFDISRLGSAAPFQNMWGLCFLFTWMDKVVIRKKC